MLYQYQELLYKYRNYANPKMKIKREVKKGSLFHLGKGFYSSTEDVNSAFLANILYGPSYISFSYALTFYGFCNNSKIVTSACSNKNKHKTITLENGTIYSYQNVPSNIYCLYINEIETNDGTYLIASCEKAFADFLYSLKSCKNIDELSHLIFVENLIDKTELVRLNKTKLLSLLKKYRGNNFKLFLDNYKDLLNGKPFSG